MSVEFYVCDKRQISEIRLLLFVVGENYYFTEGQRYIKNIYDSKGEVRISERNCQFVLGE